MRSWPLWCSGTLEPGLRRDDDLGWRLGNKLARQLGYTLSRGYDEPWVSRPGFSRSSGAIALTRRRKPAAAAGGNSSNRFRMARTGGRRRAAWIAAYRSATRGV